MGRRTKKGLDYYPQDVTWDQRGKLVRAKFGLVGVGLLVSLYQIIYQESYFCEFGEDDRILFAAECGISVDSLNEMVDFAVQRGIFDQKIYRKHQILTSAGIQRRYVEASLKRSSIELRKDLLLITPSAPGWSKIKIVVAGGGIPPVEPPEEGGGKTFAESLAEQEPPAIKVADLVGPTMTYRAGYDLLSGVLGRVQLRDNETKLLSVWIGKYSQEQLREAFALAKSRSAGSINYVKRILEEGVYVEGRGAGSEGSAEGTEGTRLQCFEAGEAPDWANG